MDNHSESRGEMSTDNERSIQNPHLSDEQLLLALDGELSSRVAVQVQAHAESCWSCRTRSEQIGEVIADYVEYRNCLINRYRPPSAGVRRKFVAELEQLARSAGQPSLWNRTVNAVRMFGAFSRYVVMRDVWIGGIVIAAFTLFVLARLGETPRVPEAPKVSASQFLEHAQAAEERALHSIAKPVIYQELRIRMGSQDVTRTIYRDPGGNRRTDRLTLSSSSRSDRGNRGSSSQGSSRSSSSQVASDLRQTFQGARLNWEDPLSPFSYRAWHNSLNQKQDEVIQSGGDFITLKTTNMAGPITESRITVRAADFHPVKEELHLRDMRLVEVSELAWNVIPIEAIDPAIFAPAIFAVEAASAPVIARPTLRISPPPGTTDAELAESEIQARVALHAEGADLGEEIELVRDALSNAAYGQRSLIVRGILGTPDRKAELAAALRGIPHVQLQLQTVEEAIAQESQRARQNPQGKATPELEPLAPVPNAEESSNQEPRVGPKLTSGDAVVVRLPIDEQLHDRFPRAEERAAFVNRVIETAQGSLAQAWALRRLRDRYTPNEVALLSRGSRWTLELLIRDDVSALRRRVDEARQLISPVLPPESAEPMSPLANSDALPSAVEPADYWRSAIAEIFPEVQKMHNGVAVFAQPGLAAPDRQARIRDLRLALIKLEALLPSLDRHVSGSFLSEPDRI